MGELAARTIFSNETGPLAGVGLDTLAKNQAAILELEGAQAPQSKTITSGSISPTSAYVIVDTEGSAAADDLDIINPVLSASENLHDGMVVYLKAADSGRVVAVKNSSSANGINTYNGSDYILSTTHWLKLQLRSGKWYEVEGRAMETALAAATAAAAASTPATTTARGIGRVATSADLVDGATINNGPAFLAAGTFQFTPTPTAHAVPQADANGKLDGWVTPTAILNTQILLTASGNYTPPKTILARITVKGAGGGGAGGTSYASYGPSGSGGGEGETVIFWASLDASVAYPLTIGAGGLAGAASADGGNGGTTTFLGRSAEGGYGGVHASGNGNGAFTGGRGGLGGGTGLTKGENGQAASVASSNAQPGGAGGGKNGGRGALTEATGQSAEAGTFGCGGGGGDYYRSTAGAKGGDGYVLIEFFDPSVAM